MHSKGLSTVLLLCAVAGALSQGFQQGGNQFQRQQAGQAHFGISNNRGQQQQQNFQGRFQNQQTQSQFGQQPQNHFVQNQQQQQAVQNHFRNPQTQGQFQQNQNPNQNRFGSQQQQHGRFQQNQIGQNHFGQQQRFAQQPQRQPTTTTTTTAAPATTQQGTLLALPEVDLCINRRKQWKFGSHYYHFSSDDAQFVEFDSKTGTHGPKKVNWLEARNACRKQCMDAVGIETLEENNMILEFMASRNITYIWTSGRLCDFTGCDAREDLKPISVFGWFWSNTNQKTPPTNSTPTGWPYQPWSEAGHFGGPQPDNAEFEINQTTESCLGVLNNIYNDGIKWHDIACYHKKPFICEDSDLLIEYIEGTNRERNLNLRA